MVVFLCGTHADLAAEREAVLGAIHDMQHEHQAMEYFGARPDRPIETCLEEVRASDVIVVIVGFLYGSMVPGSDFSYTQAEYEEAQRLEKTCLVYVRDEDSLIPAKYMERDPPKMIRLKSFRELLEGRHTVVRFRDHNDLARQVAADLNRIAEKKRRPEIPESIPMRNVQDLLERELQIAADMQRGLLPGGPLRSNRFDIAGFSLPCRYVGGDYYDYFLYPGGRIALLMGDVSGKGIPAALMMVSLQAKVSMIADYGHAPGELVTRLNRSIFANIPSNRFITLFCSMLNDDTAELVYCNAGHNPPFVARVDGTVERLSGGGPLLGILGQHKYEEFATRLDKGDVLLLYSDGVTEAMNPDEDELGDDRVAAVLRDNRMRETGEILQAVLEVTREWTAHQPAADDLSLVVVRRI